MCTEQEVAPCPKALALGPGETEKEWESSRVIVPTGPTGNGRWRDPAACPRSQGKLGSHLVLGDATRQSQTKVLLESQVPGKNVAWGSHKVH